MTGYYDLDGDGYADTVVRDPYLSSSSGYGMGGGSYGIGDPHYTDEVSGYGGLSEANWDYDCSDPYYGHEYDEGYYPDLYNYMDFVPEGEYGMPVYEAWQDNSWAEEQYALADLMYFQRQLDLDTALSEQERLARWEERLAWEQLDEEQRLHRYREFDPYTLNNLGISGGFWGRRFGGRNDLDLSYLRQVPMSRGLFSAPYREKFVRHQNLGRRYSPYFSRQRLRAFGGSSMPVRPQSMAPYGSRRLSMGAGTGMSLRERELMGRLRVAEMRASLTGLSAGQRAQALDDARRVRSEINAESRLAREVDRAERRSDALLAARQAEAERHELREERREMEGIARLEMAAGDLMSRPLGVAGYSGGFGSYY
ncbi:hypothetical protein JCM11641_005679 [Rhodosporidiobolus odoratus]